VSLVALIVAVPAVFVSQRMLVELNSMLRGLGTTLNASDLQAQLQQHPRVANLLEWIQPRLDLGQQVQAAAGMVTGKISAWVSASVWLFTQLVLTFLTLFFFLRDRGILIESLRQLIPLSKLETDDVFDRIARTVNASLYGNLLVKVIQGVLGGGMCWVLGLPSPILLGAATALFAVVPVLGTAVVWAPAAIYLVLSGSWMKALILTFWGGLVVGLIDNFLYPVLVAGELRFHPLAVFFAVFGGLLAFGIAGVVLGPVILAITVALLEIWQVRRADLSQQATG
jgi:predicted PurR-regulated permease PerM